MNDFFNVEAKALLTKAQFKQTSLNNWNRGIYTIRAVKPPVGEVLFHFDVKQRTQYSSRHFNSVFFQFVNQGRSTSTTVHY